MIFVFGTGLLNLAISQSSYSLLVFRNHASKSYDKYISTLLFCVNQVYHLLLILILVDDHLYSFCFIGQKTIKRLKNTLIGFIEKQENLDEPPDFKPAE